MLNSMLRRGIFLSLLILSAIFNVSVLGFSMYFCLKNNKGAYLFIYLFIYLWPNLAIANGTTHVFHNLWVLFHLLQVECKRTVFQRSSNETLIIDI